MKIAITGTHLVGKTTLANRLSEHLTNYELKIEPYYEMEEANFVFQEKPNVNDFKEQLTYSIKQISSSGKNTIFDRCPIDILAYLYAISEKGNIQSMYRTVQEIITSMDLIVFVPIEKPDLIDCYQYDLQGLRLKVNDIIEDWLPDFNVEILEVKGTPSERYEQVLKKMNLTSKNKNVL